MEENEEVQFLTDLVQDLFQKAGFELLAVEVKNFDNEKSIRVNVNIDSSQETSGLLIGKNGTHLESFNYLINLLYKKKYPQKTKYIHFDINNYRLVYEEKLRNLAAETAKKVAFYKQPIELPPMKPQDRRIIHLAISLMTEVESESIGQGKERRVVIKPREEI
ncbi:MAG TPA: R3H domain-containing nucleic acid-binding protein [Candidatus Paceibacterota bacterium]|nr:R3H domain-containing nucleic acid-binding protein [Candidatus Paceibacterota bacterium]